ncbi:transmembrane protein 181-like, partial [Saccostrea cucullata]|uniref:transmembrane protein 181-like n=1 Tax=Saccostrea cuccullata TaxID=36930 RepID=UPI002ED4E3B2
METEFAFSTPTWGNNVRAFLSQFSDVFSAFARYISPSYHHDRCERSVQMRLYALSKRQFVMVYIIFFVCFGISVLVGVTGPPIIETVSQNSSALPNSSGINKKTGPFVLKSPPMSTFHQQLWLIADIRTDSQGGSRFEQPFTVSVQIRGLKSDEELLSSTKNPELNTHTHNRTRVLRCSNKCDDLILLHLGYLDFYRYIITVEFYGLENTKFHFSDIIYHFKSYNTSFTNTEIWIRFVFLFLTFIVTLENPLLLPLLLLYNDPLFPLTFLVNSWVPGMFDAIFQASFLCALLLFWLCIYHGVRQTDRRFCKFYLPKLLVVGFKSVKNQLSKCDSSNHMIKINCLYSVYNGFKIFFFVVGGLYLLYLLYLL